MASKRQIKVDPKSLGELTVSMLRGEDGFQRKEIGKMLDWLATERPFDVVNLPYTLLIGLAAPLRRALGAPVCCTLQGEDLFLDGARRAVPPAVARSDPRGQRARRRVPSGQPLLRRLHARVPRHPAREDAHRPARHQHGRLYARRAARPAGDEAFTIGYFARIAPEKGLHVLAEAYRRLRARPGLGPSRLVVGGLPRARAPGVPGRASRRGWPDWGLADQFEYRGELDRAGKIAFLQGLDVMSVPATYAEPKGMFLLEAMASGVPVVQPRRGAFPEILEQTGGGLLVDAGRRGGAGRGAAHPVARSGTGRGARRRRARPACASTTASGRMAEEAEAVYRSVIAT